MKRAASKPAPSLPVPPELLELADLLALSAARRLADVAEPAAHAKVPPPR